MRFHMLRYRCFAVLYRCIRYHRIKVIPDGFDELGLLAIPLDKLGIIVDPLEHNF
jgi:hypothetical protein